MQNKSIEHSYKQTNKQTFKFNVSSVHPSIASVPVGSVEGSPIHRSVHPRRGVGPGGLTTVAGDEEGC